MNAIDQKVHDYIHKQMLEIHPNNIFTWRKGLLPDLRRKYSEAFIGRVGDMGAGSGYLSVLLARISTVSEVLCVEASKQACEQLLPRNIGFHCQSDKIEVIESSFNSVLEKKCKALFFFGSIHHSDDLAATFKTASENLVDTGFVIACEPVNSDYTSHADFFRKYSTEETFAGLQIKNFDRVDRFYRYSEYVSAAVKAGFDLIECSPVSELKRSVMERSLKGILKALFKTLFSSRKVPINFVFVFKKSSSRKIFH